MIAKFKSRLLLLALVSLILAGISFPASGEDSLTTTSCSAQNAILVTTSTYSTCGGVKTTLSQCYPTKGILIVKKHVVNDDGGRHTDCDFTIHVKNQCNDVYGSPSRGYETGKTYVLNPGTYYVSENPLEGYAGTFSGDCDSTGKVTLAAGETKTCTVTNDDQPQITKIIVIKHVVNDNGGTLDAEDFTMHISGSAGTANFAGSETGTETIVSPGSFTVSEDAATGYASSTSGACSGTIQLGQTKTCTITNDDIAPPEKIAHIIVIKHVVNDNGGTLEADDFSMHISGTAGEADFAGSESGVDTTVTEGDYEVSEDEISGYASSMPGDCSGTILDGETKTCTITNDDIAPKLTVTKIVVNDDGGSKVVADFPLFVDDTSVTSGEENEFDAGTHTVSETQQTGYTAEFSGDCNENGEVELALGDDKECIITNDDQIPPATQITVIKHVVNDDGGSLEADDFMMHVSGTVGSADFPGSETGTILQVNPGTYSISEDSEEGYAADYSSDCSGTIAQGEHKTCTVTNDDIGAELTVIKIVENNHGGKAVVSDFPLYVVTTPVVSGEENEFPAGQYYVTETQASGYAAAFSGDCDQYGNVILELGDDKTCTITNYDIAPKLTVTKVVVNDNGGTKEVSDFPLFVDDTSVTSGEENEFDAGTHTVSETQSAGYEAEFSGDCDENGEVELALGDVKECIITNDDQITQITVIKHVINNDGGTKIASDFTMHISGSVGSGTFAGAESPGVILQVNPGTYSITEDSIKGYAAVSSAECSGTVAQGEQKTCTVTNDDVVAIVTSWASNHHVILGESVHDTAHVIGKNTGGEAPMPTGSVTFFVCIVHPELTASCLPPPPTCTPGCTELGTVELVDGIAVSPDYTPTKACSYQFRADYLGDGNYFGSSDNGVKEDFTVTSLVTRTQGFWQTHTAFTGSVLQSMGGTMTVGTGSHVRTITNDQGTAQSKLFGAYYSSIPRKTSRALRSDVDHARMQLLQQLVTAKLNCEAFGCPADITELIADADSAYAGDDSGKMVELAGELDAYNNKGDSQQISVSAGSATPKTSQSIANKQFWDNP
ncbi:MAG: hypothetical protein V1702_02475 [Candidatus Woesearchaeota archaeon]